MSKARHKSFTKLMDSALTPFPSQTTFLALMLSRKDLRITEDWPSKTEPHKLKVAWDLGRTEQSMVFLLLVLLGTTNIRNSLHSHRSHFL